MDTEFKLLQEIIKSIQESKPEAHLKFDVYQNEIYIDVPGMNNITIKYNTVYIMDRHEDYYQVDAAILVEWILMVI